MQRTEQPKQHHVRQDIQALRTVAVGLVVVYHLSTAALPGGYIGVDMFFVISGFLITGQLLREAESTGKVQLLRFWARRAKRLLPAALVVLLVTLAGVWAFAPVGFRPSFLNQLAASAAYVQNWLLAGQAVDYSAAEAQASPVQHYWSLSVEEQFYIVWPIVAIVAILLARKLGSVRRLTLSTVFTWLIVLVTVASLTYSIWLTSNDPSAAYFVTTTRAWEFAVGGLLAGLAPAIARGFERFGQAGPQVRTALVWFGLITLGVTAAWYSDATQFPGAAALLPVGATALIIAANEPTTRWAPQPLFALRPVQWVGDISYGVYLWHFPLIILLPYAIDHRLGWVGGLAVTALSLGLGHLSKVVIEDPFRTQFTKSWSHPRILVVTTSAVAVTLAIPLATVTIADEQISVERNEVAALVADPAPCFGATALEPDSDCEPTPEVDPVPEPALADQAPESCLSGREGTKVHICEYGVEANEATRTVALVGDSHAEQWLAPLRKIADEERWRLLVMAKASCPFTAAERNYVSMGSHKNAQLAADCSDWNEQALAELESDPAVDTVITSAKATNQVKSTDGEQWQDAATKGYLTRWDELPSTVQQIVVIEDTPELARDVMECVSNSGARAAEECAKPQSDALGDDPIADAAAQSERAALIDLNDYLVVDDEAPPVIGGVLVYRDSHHLNWAYADTLAQPLKQALDETLKEVPEPVP